MTMDRVEPRTALITGASGGIGFELAKLFAQDEYDLVLVARGAQDLQRIKHDLQTEFGITVTAIAADLRRPNVALEIADALSSKGIAVDVLVNNAGYGDYGPFHASDWHKQKGMIDLNITALAQFTHIFSQEMVKRGNGKIMNVASTAAFQPGPLMAVYYATKAFVLSFSEAIAVELKGKGITVTALCPGPTKTNFAKAASLEGSKLFQSMKVADAASVAKKGYDALMEGKTVAITGGMNKMGTFAVRFLPRRTVRAMVGKMQSAKR